MGWVSKVLGINYKTTIIGVGVIVAACGRFALAFRSKHYDFMALADDGQLIMTTLTGILAGFGLTKAKDQNVSGAGTKATSVNDSGVVTNAEGQVVAHQEAKK